MAQPPLDDALWARLEPLLPKPRRRARRRGGRRRVSERAALTGILFVLRGGLPWQMLPREMGCGSGSTCWRRLVEWERAGVWRRLHETLLAELRRRGRLDQRWTVVDSGSVRAMRGEKNWTEPNRSPQGGVQTPHPDRLAARGIVAIFGHRAHARLAPPVSSPRRSL
jgi:transposase